MECGRLVLGGKSRLGRTSMSEHLRVLGTAASEENVLTKFAQES